MRPYFEIALISLASPLLDNDTKWDKNLGDATHYSR